MAELLVPMALAALGVSAVTGMRQVTTGGTKSKRTATLIPTPTDNLDVTRMNLDNATSTGLGIVSPEAPAFDPVMAHFEANAIPNRQDNIQVLRTVSKDPKYALTPDSNSEFQYDQMGRGATELENQWFYSNLTKDTETPLSMGFLPEYKKSTGVILRDPDTPEMLKPKKHELLEEDVFVAQPESDRRFYAPVTGELARRARNESKMASGSGALDGFYMNDAPGALAGAWGGWSTGLQPTRQFTGFHPRQRFFRVDDNLRQRNPHGLRASNVSGGQNEIRSTLDGQYTNEKKDELANYHQIAVGDGGWKQPHLPHDLRKVDLLHTQRDIATPVQEAAMGRMLPLTGELHDRLMTPAGSM